MNYLFGSSGSAASNQQQQQRTAGAGGSARTSSQGGWAGLFEQLDSYVDQEVSQAEHADEHGSEEEKRSHQHQHQPHSSQPSYNSVLQSWNEDNSPSLVPAHSQSGLQSYSNYQSEAPAPSINIESLVTPSAVAQPVKRNSIQQQLPSPQHAPTISLTDLHQSTASPYGQNGTTNGYSDHHHHTLEASPSSITDVNLHSNDNHVPADDELDEDDMDDIDDLGSANDLVQQSAETVNNQTLAYLESKLRTIQQHTRSSKQQRQQQLGYFEKLLTTLDADVDTVRESEYRKEQQYREREEQYRAQSHEKDVQIRQLTVEVGQSQQLQVRVTELEAHVHTLETKNRELQSSLDESSNEYIALQSQQQTQVEELKQVNASKDGELEQLRRQLEQHQLSDADGAPRTANGQLSELQGRYSEMQQQYQQLQQQFSELQQSTSSSQSESTAGLATLQQQYDDLLQQHQQQQQHILQLQQAAQQPTAAINAIDQTLRQEYEQLYEAYNGLVADNDQLRQQVAASATSNSDEAEQLRAQLDAAHQQLQQTQQSLEAQSQLAPPSDELQQMVNKPTTAAGSRWTMPTDVSRSRTSNCNHSWQSYSCSRSTITLLTRQPLSSPATTYKKLTIAWNTC